MGNIPQDHYEPKPGAASWLEERLPIGGLISHLQNFPTPKNLNYAYVFGGILVLFLVIQIVTGIVLSMHYQVGDEASTRMRMAHRSSSLPFTRTFSGASTTALTRLRANCCGSSAS